MYKYQRAISLLELLLSITIISSIGLMAVRYYIVTHRNTQVNQAVLQVKRLTHASYEWLQSQPQADFSDDGENEVSVEALLDAGLITSPVDTVNPWGGEISIKPGKTPSYVRVIFSDLPKLACRNMVRQLSYINHYHKNNKCLHKHKNIFRGEF